MSRYQFVEQLAATEPVQMRCRVLHVSPAGYYQWLGRAGRPTPGWEPAASVAFSRHAQRYGTRPQRPRTTVAAPAAVVAEDLLLGQPAPTALNQVWVGDITYLPLVGGRWCYLATWRATHSQRVVGWHLDQQMPTELVLMALEQALTLRQPASGLKNRAAAAWRRVCQFRRGPIGGGLPPRNLLQP